MQLGVLGTLAVAGALAFSGGPAMAAVSSPAPMAYTCTGGDFASGNFTSIPSGNYASITVTGACNIVPDAVINVVGNINVAPGAVLDAQSAPSTITVGRNVTAGSGSLLGMGCQPANYIGMFAGVPCAVEPTGHTTITVNGNVTATNADTVLMRQVTVNGNVTLTGGGGAIPWSIKGSTIAGNLTVSGVTADWLGVQFNGISGNATLTNITATDPGDRAAPSPSWRTRLGGTSTAPDSRQACPGVSSLARSTTSAATRPVSAQLWSDLVRTPPVRHPWAQSGWRTGAVTSGFRHAYGVLPNHTLRRD